MTEDEIKRLIDDDYSSARKRFARIGQRYYEAEHDILKYRLFYYDDQGKLQEDFTRSNLKIPHPFFTELTDQLVAYVLSFDENPIRAKSTAEGLQDKLDSYFDDAFWSEMSDVIAGAYTKGFDYLYGYKADDHLRFQYADSMGVVEVRKMDTDDKCESVIYWYVDRIDKGHEMIRRIQVHDKDSITYYVQSGTDGHIELDREVDPNPCPNVVYMDDEGNRYRGASLGYIPFWRLDYCKKQTSGLKPIKSLIDDYDLMECSLSNNLQDFDHPIYAVSGYGGTDLTELMQNLRTKRTVGMDRDGGLEIKTIDVPYQARKVKADEDEKNIYRFGMGFNSSQVGDGNITNVVIRSRYTLLQLKAGNLEKRLKKMLNQILEVVLDEINEQNGTDYRIADTYIEFEHVLPTNEQEDAQNELTRAQTRQTQVNTILNVAANIGDEEALRAICDLLELDYEEIKAQVPESPEASLSNARQQLANDPPKEDDSA